MAPVLGAGMAGERGGGRRGARRHRTAALLLAAGVAAGTAAALAGASAALAWALPAAGPAAEGQDISSHRRSPEATPALEELGRSPLLRQLLPSLALASQPLPALAAGQAKAPGTNFAVEYKGPIGKDFILGGGGGGVATVPQYNPRVLYVAPGGTAAAAGVRLGDEVVFVRKPEGSIVQESSFRVAERVDEAVKEAVGQGGSVIFRAYGMVQPGEQAPEFSLPDAEGKQVSLADLRSGNRKVILFFRPGRRFFNGDIDELKFFARAEAAFGELGATVVGVTNDQSYYLKRQASAYGAKYPLLSDTSGEVTRSYGALLDLQGQKPAVDRKTYVIGADGKVEAVFPAVGWEVKQTALAAHLAQLAAVLRGDPAKMAEIALPRPKSVGDVIALSQQR